MNFVTYAYYLSVSNVKHLQLALFATKVMDILSILLQDSVSIVIYKVVLNVPP